MAPTLHNADIYRPVANPDPEVRSQRNKTTRPSTQTVSILSHFSDAGIMAWFSNVYSSGESTSFPGLEHTKLRNTVAYKLHNAYS